MKHLKTLILNESQNIPIQINDFCLYIYDKWCKYVIEKFGEEFVTNSKTCEIYESKYNKDVYICEMYIKLYENYNDPYNDPYNYTKISFTITFNKTHISIFKPNIGYFPIRFESIEDLDSIREKTLNMLYKYSLINSKDYDHSLTYENNNTDEDLENYKIISDALDDFDSVLQYMKKFSHGDEIEIESFLKYDLENVYVLKSYVKSQNDTYGPYHDYFLLNKGKYYHLD